MGRFGTVFKSIRSRLALSFAAIALVAAVVLGAVLLTILQNYYAHLEFDYLRGNARFVGSFVAATQSDNAPHDEVQSQIENLAFLSQARIQVYGANQQLLYDSGSPQNIAVNLGVMKQLIAQGDSPPNAPYRVIAVNPKSAQAPVPGAKEFFDFGSTSSASAPVGAISAAPSPNGGTVIYRSIQVAGSPFGFDLNAATVLRSVRSDTRLKQAIVDPKSGSVLGSIVLSEGPAYGSDILASVASGWMLASAIAVLLAAAVGWFISRRISAPLLVLTNATALMAAGDLSSRADVKSRDEIGRLARSFNEMADQVEGTVTALRRFVSDASHELQTPLTALRTNLDLTADENNASDRHVYVERAQAMVKRLEVLNNNLLDLSRLEANGHAAKETVVDLTELLKQSGEIYASQAEQAGLSLEYELPAVPTPIRGDPVQVRRVVDNLVDNACKFTPAGGTVAIRLDRAGDRVLLSVADTGIGVPEEDLPQLFNRFHRGRNATAFPGSGLGLAIVKAIMEQQGGQITAENLAQGALFTLAWPSAE
jgi:signal transduction histidine kinase